MEPSRLIYLVFLENQAQAFWTKQAVRVDPRSQMGESES